MKVLEFGDQNINIMTKEEIVARCKKLKENADQRIKIGGITKYEHEDMIRNYDRAVKEPLPYSLFNFVQEQGYAKDEAKVIAAYLYEFSMKKDWQKTKKDAKKVVGSIKKDFDNTKSFKLNAKGKEQLSALNKKLKSATGSAKDKIRAVKSVTILK